MTKNKPSGWREKFDKLRIGCCQNKGWDAEELHNNQIKSFISQELLKLIERVGEEVIGNMGNDLISFLIKQRVTTGRKIHMNSGDVLIKLITDKQRQLLNKIKDEINEK
jgi:hypothetical protein